MVDKFEFLTCVLPRYEHRHRNTPQYSYRFLADDSMTTLNKCLNELVSYPYGGIVLLQLLQYGIHTYV
jgi:hypothetical protein